MALSLIDWIQQGNDINGKASGDFSGTSEDINASGDTVIIGAPENNNGGYATVYKFNGSSWQQYGNDINAVNLSDDTGRGVTINNYGNIIAVGSPGSSGGYVTIYEYNIINNDWNQKGNRIGTLPSFGLGFRLSSDSNGDIIAMSAPFDSNGTVSIYEYDTINNNWNQKGSDIEGDEPFDDFGESLSMSLDGNVVIIGAADNDDNGQNSGLARVYEWNSVSNSWVQKGQTLKGLINNSFGYDVAINSNGNTIVISSIGFLIPDSYVNVYEWDSINSSWIQKGSSIIGEDTFEKIGYSVSINSNGNIISLGSPFAPPNSRGYVKVFEWINTNWTQIGTINGKNMGDQAGSSVSLNNDGNILSIGSPYNDNNGSNSGHVRVFKSNSKLKNIVIKFDITDVCGNIIQTYNRQEDDSYRDQSGNIINILGSDEYLHVFVIESINNNLNLITDDIGIQERILNIIILNEFDEIGPSTCNYTCPEPAHGYEKKEHLFSGNTVDSSFLQTNKMRLSSFSRYKSIFRNTRIIKSNNTLNYFNKWSGSPGGSGGVLRNKF